MGGVLCLHYIYIYIYFKGSMLVLISIPCRCSKVVIFYFFNHYQVGPTVLYYSCKLAVRFCLVHQVFVFRLLFNESIQRFFFFLIITKWDPLILYIELYQEQKSTTTRSWKGGTGELVVKSSFSHNLHQTLTHNSYIKSHKNAGKRLNKITIKFDTELSPIKNVVVNHNLQNS